MLRLGECWPWGSPSWVWGSPSWVRGSPSWVWGSPSWTCILLLLFLTSSSIPHFLSISSLHSSFFFFLLFSLKPLSLFFFLLPSHLTPLLSLSHPPLPFSHPYPPRHTGVGGQVDFLRGATLSHDGLGKPILAMPSVTSKGISKIVPFVKEGE